MQPFALNDVIFIHGCLVVFSTSPSYAALLHWFCDRGALSFSVGTSRLRLHLSESTRTTSANLVEYLSTHKGNKQSLISPSEPTERDLTASQKLARKFGPEYGRTIGRASVRVRGWSEG